MPTFIDRTENIFERLTVTKLDKIEKGVVFWFCRCVCRNILSVRGNSLVSGTTKSCGCLKDEKSYLQGKKFKTHGMTKTRFYQIWHNMKRRCLDSKMASYPNYGGRGVTVCERWLKFENFMEDMYLSYLEHVKQFGEKNISLDCIDSLGNYEFTNCKWSTWKIQQRNRRDSAKSENYDEHMYWKRKLLILVNDVIFRGNHFYNLFEQYVGCSAEEFKKYLEPQFLFGMTWNNHGRGLGKWQLDHIFGCNNFDLSKEGDRKKCFNYKNMRPMWYTEHRKKSVFRLTPV